MSNHIKCRWIVLNAIKFYSMLKFWVREWGPNSQPDYRVQVQTKLTLVPFIYTILQIEVDIPPTCQKSSFFYTKTIWNIPSVKSHHLRLQTGWFQICTKATSPREVPKKYLYILVRHHFLSLMALTIIMNQAPGHNSTLRPYLLSTFQGFLDQGYKDSRIIS